VWAKKRLGLPVREARVCYCIEISKISMFSETWENQVSTSSELNIDSEEEEGEFWCFFSPSSPKAARKERASAREENCTTHLYEKGSQPVIGWEPVRRN